VFTANADSAPYAVLYKRYVDLMAMFLNKRVLIGYFDQKDKSD